MSVGPTIPFVADVLPDAGAVISTVKGTFYEWVRTLHFADEHLDPEICSGDRPDGIEL